MVFYYLLFTICHTYVIFNAQKDLQNSSIQLFCIWIISSLWLFPFCPAMIFSYFLISVTAIVESKGRRKWFSVSCFWFLSNVSIKGSICKTDETNNPQCVSWSRIGVFFSLWTMNVFQQWQGNLDSHLILFCLNLAILREL